MKHIKSEIERVIIILSIFFCMFLMVVLVSANSFCYDQFHHSYTVFDNNFTELEDIPTTITDSFVIKQNVTVPSDNLFFGVNNSIAAKGSNYAYRSLTATDAASLRAGNGLLAKVPNGSWTLEQHLINVSSSNAWLNNPWIATSTDIDVARAFSSGNGLARINLSKLPASSMQRGWLSLPRSSAGYYYSIWQQEVSIFQHIPQNAITIIK